MLKKIAIISLWFAASIALAAPQDSPINLLENVTKQALSQIKAKGAQKNRPVAKRIIDKVLLPHVNMNYISQMVMGPYWRTATSAQKKRFEEQFATLLANTYATALMNYTNETVKFFPIRGGYQGKTQVTVDSKIIPSSAPPVNLKYFLIKHKSWKVYDISVEGISLLSSFQSQLRQEAKAGGMTQVLNVLTKHNKKFAAPK